MKVPKTAVLYMGKDLNRHEFTCGGCALFIVRRTEASKKFGQCEVLYPPEVDNDDGCGLYIPGISKHGLPAKRQIPALTAGLEEGPFTCKRCRHFHGSPEQSGSCEIVEGSVHPDGCCNAWEKA